MQYVNVNLGHQMNMLRIGMLLGSGNELGIGIETHPDIDMAVSISSAIRTATLRLFFNSEDSPAYLDYMPQYQGFCQALPGIPQDP